jgi:two-component system sensor histidine kinase UhpB
LSQLNSLDKTRHLSIQLKKTTGKIINFAHNKRQTDHDKMPPQWFINLVATDYPEVKHQIITFDDQPIKLIIKADPLDEISEVWHESIGFLASIFLLTLLTFLAVNLVFNKALISIARIVDSLKIIETGQYRKKLPEFAIKEYDSIAKAINHMTSVLDKSQHENKALTQHTLEIQEEERQKLAQELHDELGQSLTAIKVMAVTATREKADTQKITHSIIGICDHLMTVVRSMMHQLHPLMLTELGLKATLEDMLDHWSERNPELILSLECTDAVEELEQKISIQVFRVIQECLTNVIRHAHAKRVRIELNVINEVQKKLQLKVTDDGQGCDINVVSSGFGLLGMQERIKTLEGELTFKSQAQQGLTVIAFIPMK